MKNPKAQIIQIKHVLDEENSEFLHYYEEDQDKFVYCFFGDLEIDGNLRLDWEGYRDAKNFAEGFYTKYNIHRGWLISKFNTLTLNGKEVENPVEKAGIVPGDTIHTINGYPVLPPKGNKVLKPDGSIDTDIMFAGFPKEVKVEYIHLGESAATTVEPCYIDDKPTLGINRYFFEQEESPELHGICVFGNLKVNGSVVNRTLEGGPMLYVSGNLEADNLIAGGAFVEVKGTTTVKHYVYGHYNDGITRLGDVVAKAVIGADHDISFGNVTGSCFIDYDLDEFFDPKYKNPIDAMLDGADIIADVKE